MATKVTEHRCRCGHTNGQHEWIELMLGNSTVLVWANVCKEDCPCEQFDPEGIFLGGAPT